MKCPKCGKEIKVGYLDCLIFSCEHNVNDLFDEIERLKSEMTEFKEEIQEFIEDLVIHGYPIERDEAIKLDDKILGIKKMKLIQNIKNRR